MPEPAGSASTLKSRRDPSSGKKRGPENSPGISGGPKSRQAAPRSSQVRPGPRGSGEVRARKNSKKFQKIPKNSKKTRNFGKNPKNGQKTAKKRPFPTVPVQLKSRNFKIFGKKAISGHHLGVFEILARRGVSSLFRFMRNDPRPYRTNKRLSEFNSGL